MNPVVTGALSATLALTLSPFAQAQDVKFTEPLSTPTEFIQTSTTAKAIARQEELFHWLTASRHGDPTAAFSLHLTAQDLRDIGAGEPATGELRANPRRVQVGVDKPLGSSLNFANLAGKSLRGAAPFEGGVAGEGLDGDLVWSAVAQSEGASGLRLGFTDFQLPAGAALYVYNSRGEAFGPYTGRGPNGDGEFWSNTISGDRVTLQLHHFGRRDRATLSAMGFTLASISHMGPRLPLNDILGQEDTEKAFCSYNNSEGCVMPGSEGGAEVSEAKKAVALMIYTSGGGSYICSGGLLADTDSGSTIPYFLTANHCISKGREAKSLETVFDFDGDCSDRYGNGNYPNRTNGSSIKSSNRTSDYTLLELNQEPGGTRAYLGWTNAPVAFSGGDALYRISHPAGAPQAYSHHTVDTSTGTCTSWPRGSWIYSYDQIGATEGGSSGSPVLNAAGLVVGQLSGACGTNVNNTCDRDNNATVDGALAAYWSAVEPFLAPGDPPPPPPNGDATVQGVVVSVVSQGPWNRGQATVTVVDGSGNPVANASVLGTFSGDVSGSASGTTDASGVAVIRSGRTRSNINSVGFCVDTVNGSAATGNTCG